MNKQFCLLKENNFELPADVDANRKRAIMNYKKVWENGRVLRYHFMEKYPGKETQKQIVRDCFKAWKNVGLGISFEETDGDAEIRIGFMQGDGAWSYLGKDCASIPLTERTMNFGWDLTEDIDTALHEIGHAIGLNHEHQNPNAGIVWDEEAVYEELASYPNYWSRQTTYDNIIKKLDYVQGSDWDKDSVMHYPFKAGLITKPEIYQTTDLTPKGGLSDLDKKIVQSFYPQLQEQTKITPPYNQKIYISKGEQKDFVIVPETTDEYIIMTSGYSDTFISLFEDLELIAENDDSGYRWNAKIITTLNADTEYVLKLRLYSQYKSGDTFLNIHHN
jgi:hypothetical protein